MSGYGAEASRTSSASWATLSIYESVELAKRFARERTGREPTEAEASGECGIHFGRGPGLSG